MSRGKPETLAEMKKEYDEALPLLDRLQAAARPGQGLAEFLASMSTDVEADDAADGEKVVVSTIHSAKGLEWDVVHVVDCVDGMLPKASDGEELQEELRCFYVAVTRAKQRLVLYAPRQTFTFGRAMPRDPSRFLDGCRRYISEERR